MGQTRSFYQSDSPTTQLISQAKTPASFHLVQGGERGCPGISYAIVEMEFAIANLLYWFDWMFHDGATTEDLNMA